MKKFKTKPEFIDAVQFDGSNLEEIKDFIETDTSEHISLRFTDAKEPFIKTPRCDMYIKEEDWVIKKGIDLFYVEANDIFVFKYDLVIPTQKAMPGAIEALSTEFDVILVRMEDRQYSMNIVGASRLLRDLRSALEMAVGYNNVPG